MKKTTLLAAMLVSSAILGAQVSHAAEGEANGPLELETHAHVKFLQEDESTDPTDPEVPGGGGEGETVDPENPGGVTPENNGPLAILFAPHFEFGEHTMAAKDLNVPAFSQIVTTEGNDVAHFVQVKDARGTHKGWDLSVKAEQLSYEGGKAIDGAVIKLATQNIDSSNGNGVVETAMTEIALDGKDAQTVMTAAADNGQGIHSVQWGSADSIKPVGEDLFNNDVTLFIPSTSVTMATVDKDYTANLTWTLNGNDADAVSATPLLAK